MSNILEYTLSLNDQISGKLQKIGINTDSALNVFSKIQSQANAAAKVMGDMGRSVGSLQQKLEALKSERDWIPSSAINDIRRYNTEIKKTEREITKLQTINGSKFKSLIKDAFNQAPAAGLFTNPLILAGAGITAITKLGMENEKTKVSFEVLMGSQEKASKLLKEMSNYAAATPYEKADLQESGKVMLGFGIAQEKVMTNLKMIGDIAMGDANKMQSLTLAFSQISSAGKMQGQDLLQLINAGFNPLNEISKMTGKSMASLRDDMEKGKISAQMVEAAFAHATGPGGQFFQMTEKMGQTLGGKLSTLIDDFKNILLQLYNVIAPILIPALQVVGFVLGTISGLFEWFFTGISEGNFAVLGLAVVLGSLGVALTVNYLYTKRAVAWTMIKNAWDVISAATMGVLTGAIWAQNAAWYANPLGWIIGLCVLLIGAIVLVVAKTEGWGKQWDRVVTMAKSSLDIFVDGFMIGIDRIRLAWYKFKNVFGLGDSVENNKMINQLSTDIERRQKEIVAAKNKIKDNAKWEVKFKTEDKKETAGLNNSQVLAGVSGSNNSGSNTGKQTTEAVASGGTRNTAITINLGKQVENVYFNGTASETGKEQLEVFTENLRKVLLMAASVSN